MGHGSGVVAVIPARWGSTRFPGKALARLAGEPIIAHVVRRASEAASVEAVVVATDDQRIAAAAAAVGAETVMTGEHESGTDRVAAAVLPRDGWSIAINVQGDEPMLPPENIEALIRGLEAEPGCLIGTLCRPLGAGRAEDPNAVKVVRGVSGRALYFSRSLIPFPRSVGDAEALWRLHLGIYAYRREGLERFVSLPPSPLERAEGLEQLRALENGLDVLVLDAPKDSWGVDTPEDLAMVAELMRNGPSLTAAER